MSSDSIFRMSSDSGSEQLDYDLQIDSPRKNIKQHGDKPGKPKEGGSSKSKEDGVSKPIFRANLICPMNAQTFFMNSKQELNKLRGISSDCQIKTARN